MLWLVMEYCAYGSVSSLTDSLRSSNKSISVLKRNLWNENIVAFILHESLLGLEYLHGNFVLHRDIKGQNILFSRGFGVKVYNYQPNPSTISSRSSPSAISIAGVYINDINFSVTILPTVLLYINPLYLVVLSIYLYICTHTHTHTYIYIYIRTNTYTRAHTHTHTHTHTHIYIYIYYTLLLQLCDLGVSACLSETVRNRSTAIGTPYWMAPEVIACRMHDGGSTMNAAMFGRWE